MCVEGWQQEYVKSLFFSTKLLVSTKNTKLWVCAYNAGSSRSLECEVCSVPWCKGIRGAVQSARVCSEPRLQ